MNLFIFFFLLFHAQTMATNPDNVTAKPFLDSLQQDDRFTEWTKNLRNLIRADIELDAVWNSVIKVYALGGNLEGVKILQQSTRSSTKR